MIIENNKKIFTEDELNELNNVWYPETEKRWDMKDRRYTSCYSNKHQQIVDKLLRWVESVGDMKLKSYNIDLIFHKFQVNDRFDSHIDFSDVNSNLRLFATGFLIDNNFSGGDYVVDDYGILSKEVGVPYLFASDKLHRIEPIISGTRKSVLIFLFSSNIKRIGLNINEKTII